MSGGIVLRDFGVAFGEQVVLADVNLTLPARGVVVLLGPSSAGKSTLLRTLAGLNFAQPSLRLCGTVTIAGTSWPDDSTLPTLVTQHARLLISTIFQNIIGDAHRRAALSHLQQRAVVCTLLLALGLDDLITCLDDEVSSLRIGQQRLVAIARQLVNDPKVLLADEPTANLDAHDVDDIIRVLRAQGERRLVVVVTHNQQHARQLGGLGVLFAGGHVVETAPIDALLNAPQTPTAQAFARTGSCSLPAPGSNTEHLAADAPQPVPVPVAFSQVPFKRTPRTFRWTEAGAVGGMPRPGFLDELDEDLRLLADLGVRTVVTLEETRTVDPLQLAAVGISSVFFPIKDMAAPTIDAAYAHVEQMRAAHLPVAYHCRAGLGRTGTLLAAHLIFTGVDVVDAIARVRDTIPRSIQSDEQVCFLQEFATHVRAHAHASPLP